MITLSLADHFLSLFKLEVINGNGLERGAFLRSDHFFTFLDKRIRVVKTAAFVAFVTKCLSGAEKVKK